jgi:ATP-dependent protease ClpP protease subunit
MQLEILALADNKATVLIKGEIGQSGDNNALAIAEQLKAIVQNEIHISIASEGGSLAEALSIRAEIKRFILETGKTVIFHLEKMVASAATVIPMIKESRVIGAANMLFMLHPAYSAESVVGHGTAADHIKTAEIIKEYTKLWAAALMEKSGLSESQVNKWILETQTDTNMTELDALKFGFIDEIGAASVINASLLPKDLSGIPDDWLKANQIIAKKEDNVMTPEEQAAADKAAADKAAADKAAADKVAAVTDGAAIDKTMSDLAGLGYDSELKLEISLKNAREQARQDGIEAKFAIVKDNPDILAMKKVFLVDETKTAKDAQTAILAKLGAGQQSVGSASAGQTGGERFINDATHAILARAGLGAKQIEAAGFKGSPDARLRSMKLERIAEQALINANYNYSRTDAMGMIAAAFTQSTSDFPLLLENVLHKTLLSAYNTAQDKWSRFCAVGSVSDFRASNRYRTAIIGSLDSLTELGEFKNKAIPDGEKATMTIGTKGNIINISRQAIINDDLGAFVTLAQNLARAAKRTIEKDVFALLVANPTLDDGVALFHATHGNLGTNAVVTMASIDEARQLMMKQTAIGSATTDAEYLDLSPSIWLGPVVQGGNARAVNAAQFDPDITSSKQNRPNIVMGLFSDVVDTARITTTAWYAFANPAEAPVIEVAFLNGNMEPYIEMQQGWNVDGSAWKVRLDYGVAAIDYRGAVKNAGA